MDMIHPFNALKAEQFAGILVDTLNKASLALMLSLGHRTGLFDRMQEMEPSTSQQIASKANLSERYVREWLGAMVSGGIVEYEAISQTYYLPLEHAAFLTRQAGGDNMAAFAQFITGAAQVEDEIVECFHHGGGISYAKYPRLLQAMAEDQSVINTFVNGFLPAMPAMEEKLSSGIFVLDLGCGAGTLLLHLAAKFPNSQFTGVDLLETSIHQARKESVQKGLSNIQFLVKDLSDFEITAPQNRYDLILTIDAIHDQHKPMSVLKGIHKSLKEEGVYIMVDINGTGQVHKDVENPFAAFLYSISCMHCVPVSLGQGGEGLGAMWGVEKIRAYSTQAGFSSIELKSFPTDPINTWYMIRK